MNQSNIASSQPLVSVALGTFNGSKWIERAIKSILNQTYQNFEILVCDDCSTDNTVEVVENLMKTDNRIHLIKNTVNLGLNIVLNNCIEVAKGELIARMDDDDISHPERFSKQVAFLLEYPEFALVGCGKNYFDDNGIWGQSVAKAEPTVMDVFTSHAYSHPTVMIRKAALVDVGNYSTNSLNRRGQDYDLWCKLYYKGYRGANLSDILFDYYESPSSIRRRKLKYRIDHIKKELLWWSRLQLPISALKYPLMDIIKCAMPNSLYTYLRKRKFR